MIGHIDCMSVSVDAVVVRTAASGVLGLVAVSFGVS